jgi:hypothetical protein
MIALDNRRREIPEVAEAVRRGSQRRPPEGGRYKINCEESAWPASWHAGAHPFDPVRRDLRMNCPVGRFTSGAPSENRTRRESPIADWRAHADFARAQLVGALGFDVDELECGAGAVGFDSDGVLFIFGAGFQGDFVGLGFFVFAS